MSVDRNTVVVESVMAWRRGILSLLALAVASAAHADFDAAAVFGMRPSVVAVTLSPDGRRIAYVAPDPGRGGMLYVADAESVANPLAVLHVQAPQVIDRCDWVDTARLLCNLTGLHKNDGEPQPYRRLVAVDADGGNLKLLANGSVAALFGLDVGAVIDLHGGVPGTVLVETESVTRGKYAVGVERLDTRSGTSATVENANPGAGGFLSDGGGTVMITAVRRPRRGGYDPPGTMYMLRRAPGAKWEPFSEWDFETRGGFLPLIVDGRQRRVYGLQNLNGRLAAYAWPIDGGPAELVHADDNVDVDQFATLGSSNAVVGVSVVRDHRETIYFDADLRDVVAAIHRALPGDRDVQLADASADRRRILVFVASDTDPGVYYLYDRDSHRMQTLYVVRSELEGVALGRMVPVHYPAADGTSIPAYLTLPPGVTNASGLPALIMPHGGPTARDEWGFDWLVQFYAHQGYAVLQPNFRGSAGYGDAWQQTNGFRSWRTSIGDIVDGARWMVASGRADAKRLAIVGWSYGGYAALQAAVTAPDLFRAVVAVAPVTDLPKFKESFRYSGNFREAANMLGSGQELKEGSPARQAKRLRVPVLLVHGRADGNVPFSQTEIMDRALKAAGVTHQVLPFDGLAHSLNDAAARATLLRTSDEFLRRAFERDAAE